MYRRLWVGAVALGLCGCGGAESDYTVISRPSVIASEPRASDSASPEAPRKVVIALQTCADHYAYRFSPNSYAVLYDIEATKNGITAVKVKDSMVAGSDLEACLTRALERMELPATALNGQSVSPQSRSAVGVVQAAAAPIALAPIVLVVGGVAILVGVTIYVATTDVTVDEVLDAARRRRPKPTKNRCLDAAAGGEYLWKEFCNSISNSDDRRECWKRMMESEQNKRGWCNWKFGN